MGAKTKRAAQSRQELANDSNDFGVRVSDLKRTGRSGSMTSSMDRDRKWTVLLGVALCLATLAGFWGVYNCGFINYDDPEYVTRNPHVSSGLTWPNIAWAFTNTHAGNWHPLTWLSHMLDCQLFGLNASAHHLVNALFHTANTLLLFLLLGRLTGTLWRSALVAALFGLHPLHVESVAWVAERKDVLSACFFTLTLWAWCRYVEGRGSTGRRNCRSIWYGLALVFFALGLMSKPMLVTLPFVLLLLDFWPLERLKSEVRSAKGEGRERRAKGEEPEDGRSRMEGGRKESEHRASNPGLRAPNSENRTSDFSLRNSFSGRQLQLVVEKLPFFALSVISCAVTFIAQRQEGAVAAVGAVPIDLRLENAPVSYLVYLLKLFWPSDLAVYYPIPRQIPLITVILVVATLVLISLLAWRARRRWPFVTVGWLWYAGMLVPVIGLVQVGLQAHADRYTYLPYIGLFIAFVWGIEKATRSRPGRRIILTAASLLVIGFCFALTRSQVRYWQDSETLFRHTIAIAPNNPVARLNLGSALIEQGKFADAEQQFAEAVRVAPGYAEAQSNLGFALAMQNKTDAAIDRYRKALALNPHFERTHSLLGEALLAKGRKADAISEYRAALERNPDWPAALNDLAWLLATDPDSATRDGAEAVRLAERACRLTEFREALFIGTLAAAYAEVGRFDAAVATAQKAEQAAVEAGQGQIAERNRQLLEVYKAGKAYHEAGPP